MALEINGATTMSKYQVQLNIYSRLLNDIEPDYKGSYSNHWCKTLEEAEAKIFCRTANLDRDIMAYKALIKKDGQTVAEWGNDVRNL
jgi:hypothetical protein